jgi:hypothetical protein
MSASIKKVTAIKKIDDIFLVFPKNAYIETSCSLFVLIIYIEVQKNNFTTGRTRRLAPTNEGL